MCGIYGSMHDAKVQVVLEKMKARGPDQRGVIRYAGFSMGFNRLAIVDIDICAAMQPHVSKKGRVVVMNGEIYNYHSLDPHATSEVALLGAMLDAKADPRQFIDGDYAIASFEPSERRLTLYRDRFGVCPLYYQLKPHLAISSERRYLDNPREVMPYERVVLSYAKGSAVGKLISRDRWQHYGVTIDRLLVSDGALTTFSSLFENSVASRAKHSDVGFSVTCSGGLDSTAVIYALRQMGLRPQQMLCVNMGTDLTEDGKYAIEVAGHTGFPLKMIYLPEKLSSETAASIRLHMDEAYLSPLAWRVAVRNWFVAREATTKVVLTGEGADELHSGYPPHTERIAVPWRLAQKQMQAVRSLPRCSLELSNKIGLAHSVEFRAPFLKSTLSYWMLATQTGPRKEMLRRYLQRQEASPALINRNKWGTNEQLLDSSVPVTA